MPYHVPFDEVEPETIARLKNKLKAACYNTGGVNWEKLFRFHDRDRQDGLQLHEFRHALRKDAKLSPRMLSDDLLAFCFRAVDVSNLGLIGVNEFLLWLNDEPVKAKSKKSSKLGSPVRTPRNASPPRSLIAFASPTRSGNQPPKAKAKGSAKRENKLSAAPSPRAVSPLTRKWSPERQRELDSPSSLAKIRLRLRAAAYSAGGPNWEKLFRHYDRDNSGGLRLREFRSALRRDAKIPPRLMSDDQIARIFSEIDKNRCEIIDYAQFAQFVEDPNAASGNPTIFPGQPSSSSKQMAASPKNKKKSIKKSKKTSKKRASELETTTDFSDSLTSSKQSKKDGLLKKKLIGDSKTSLVAEFNSTPAGKKSRAPAHSASGIRGKYEYDQSDSREAQITQLKQKLKAAAYAVGGVDWRKLFRHYDRDNSGMLSREEFRSAIRRDGKLTAYMLSDDALNSIFDMLDVNRSNTLEIDEFLAWMGDAPALDADSPRAGSPVANSDAERERQFLQDNGLYDPPPKAKSMASKSMGKSKGR